MNEKLRVFRSVFDCYLLLKNFLRLCDSKLHYRTNKSQVNAVYLGALTLRHTCFVTFFLLRHDLAVLS